LYEQNLLRLRDQQAVFPAGQAIAAVNVASDSCSQGRVFTHVKEKEFTQRPTAFHMSPIAKQITQRARFCKMPHTATRI
jgi:hypothetical protein